MNDFNDFLDSLESEDQVKFINNFKSNYDDEMKSIKTANSDLNNQLSVVTDQLNQIKQDFEESSKKQTAILLDNLCQSGKISKVKRDSAEKVLNTLSGEAKEVYFQDLLIDSVTNSAAVGGSIPDKEDNVNLSGHDWKANDSEVRARFNQYLQGKTVSGVSEIKQHWNDFCKKENIPR